MLIISVWETRVISSVKKAVPGQNEMFFHFFYMKKSAATTSFHGTGQSVQSYVSLLLGCFLVGLKMNAFQKILG